VFFNSATHRDVLYKTWLRDCCLFTTARCSTVSKLRIAFKALYICTVQQYRKISCLDGLSVSLHYVTQEGTIAGMAYISEGLFCSESKTVPVHTMKAFWGKGRRYSSIHSLTSTVDGSEWWGLLIFWGMIIIMNTTNEMQLYRLIYYS